MNKFALVGRGIQHSQSPALYREYISQDIQYDLLDFRLASEIPRIQDLFKEYDGINITAPYKEHFLKDVKLSMAAEKLQAINCLAMKKGIFYGENTDYLAIIDILKEFIKNHPHLEIVILGDGVMARVMQIALSELGKAYLVYSRKLTANFDDLNFKDNHNKDKFSLIINTCSRDFVCHFPMPSKGIFWDLNYQFSPHIHRFSTEEIKYIDGMEMLKLQARHAVAFWFGI